MNHHPATLLGVLVVGLSLLGRHAPVSSTDDLPPADSRNITKYVGVASCAAMNCHNGNGLQGQRGSEFTTWVTHDRHARAYEVLYNKLSQTIMANLHGKTTPKRAWKETLCLQCHVAPGYTDSISATGLSKEDGVACEACHGPASQWLTKHYKPSWQKLSPQEKSAFGLRDTKSAAGRAQTCVACHVGAPGMDVNHDLIAAGHPWLKFEFGVYHANLPPHWDSQKDIDPTRDPRGRPDFAIHAWEVGQIVTAQAALELLAARATDVKQPWPEFAEYDCFACHHALQGPSWRQQLKPGAGAKKSGQYAWGTWYETPLLNLVPLPPGKPAQEAQSTLAELRSFMQAKAVPDRARAQAESAATAKLLHGLLPVTAKSTYSAVSAANTFRQFAKMGVTADLASWDEAAQIYLALAAVHQGWKDLDGKKGPPAAIQDQLNDIVKQLRFKAGQSGPDASSTPKKLQQLFEKLIAP